jgi:hypothetical protein
VRIVLVTGDVVPAVGGCMGGKLRLDSAGEGATCDMLVIFNIILN